MAKPLHLCHNKASASYPSSFERKRPASEVTAAVNAASSKSPSPARLTVSLSLFFVSMNKDHNTYNTSNTMGKCNSKGCMRPATCCQPGITILLSSKRKNSSRQLKAKQQLNKTFLTVFSIKQQGLVCMDTHV